MNKIVVDIIIITWFCSLYCLSFTLGSGFAISSDGYFSVCKQQRLWPDCADTKALPALAICTKI